jgi:hypothetical protein
LLLFAALGPTGACLILWLVFAALITVALKSKPPWWLIPVLTFSIAVVMAAAVAVTFDASGYKIKDLVSVLEQLHIESPQEGGSGE